QPVHIGGGLGPVLFQLMHAAAGHGGERGFRRREKSRDRQQEHDGGDGVSEHDRNGILSRTPIITRFQSGRNDFTASSGTSRVTKAFPNPCSRMKVSLPSVTFLSWAIWRINSPAPGRGPGMSETALGRPAVLRWRTNRSAS